MLPCNRWVWARLEPPAAIAVVYSACAAHDPRSRTFKRWDGIRCGAVRMGLAFRQPEWLVEAGG